MAILFTSLGISHLFAWLGRWCAHWIYRHNARNSKQKLKCQRQCLWSHNSCIYFSTQQTFCNSVWVLCLLLLKWTQWSVNTAIKIQH